MNKRHYEHTLPNIRGSLSNTYVRFVCAFVGGVAAFWGGWLPMLAVLAVVVFLVRSVWRILSAFLSLCVLALFILVLCVIL